jgi:DNA-binding SARP family transcriptional activator
VSVVNASRLELLGAPRLIGVGLAVPLDRKLAGVLAYLALEGATPRAVLAELLWANVTPDKARQSLRQALQRVQPLSGVFASSDPLRLEANIAVDALEEHDTLARGGFDPSRLERGLLEGLAFDDCPEFSEWLRIERERLEEARRSALALEAERLEKSGALLEALRVAQRRLALDALSEAAHRSVMRLHASLGDRTAARRVFEALTQTLARELGVTPLEETRALAQSIASGEPSKITPPNVVSDPLALEVRVTRAEKLLQDGNRLEARHLATSALEAAEAGVVRQRAQLVVAQSWMLEGAMSDAVPFLEAAAVSSDANVRLRALMNLGNVSSMLHGPARGMGLFEQALRLAHSAGSTLIAATLHNNLASSHVRLGQLVEAQHHLERAVALFARAERPANIVQARGNLTHLHLMRARLNDALSSGREALAEAERLGSLPLTASALFALGLALRRVGDPSAADAFKRALAIHQELNDAWQSATLEFNLRALTLESDATRIETTLSALERLNTTNDAALIGLCTLEVALLCDDPALMLELATRGLKSSQTPQTRLMHAIAHARATGNAAALEGRIEPNLHETGLAHATRHALLLEPANTDAANTALDAWHAHFELETRGLTPTHREGRWAYYTRRLPASSLRAMRALLEEFTLT